MCWIRHVASCDAVLKCTDMHWMIIDPILVQNMKIEPLVVMSHFYQANCARRWFTLAFSADFPTGKVQTKAEATERNEKHPGQVASSKYLFLGLTRCTVRLKEVWFLLSNFKVCSHQGCSVMTLPSAITVIWLQTDLKILRHVRKYIISLFAIGASRKTLWTKLLCW